MAQGDYEWGEPIRDSEIGDLDYDAYADNSGHEDASGYTDQSVGSLEDHSSRSSRLRDRNDPNKPAYSHKPYFEEQQRGQNSYNETQKSLANAEKGAAIGGNSKKNSKTGVNSINKQESASNPMGYKKPEESAGSGKKGKQQGGFLSRRKKSVVGWIIALTIGGGIMGIGTLVSGPMQFIQAMNFIRNTIMFITEVQTGVRMMGSLNSAARGARTAVAGNIQYRRLGIIGNRMADGAIGSMAGKGVNFSGTTIAGNPRTMDINLTRLPFDSNDIRRIDHLITVRPDGSATLDFRKMSYRDAKRLVNRTNGVGRFDIKGQMKTRKTLRKVGKISWLSPLRKLQYWAINMVVDTAEDIFRAYVRHRAQKVARGGGRAIQDAASRGVSQELANHNSRTQQAARNAASNATQQVAEDATQAGIRKKKMGAIPIIGVVLLAIEVACAMQELRDALGRFNYENIVAPAQGNAAEIVAIGSQVMSGYNIDMDTVGAATRQRMFNPAVEIVEMTGDQRIDDSMGVGVGRDEDDNSYEFLTSDENSGRIRYDRGSETVESSWWHSPAVRVNLGQQPTQQQMDGVPAALRTVANTELSFGGSAGIQATWNVLETIAYVITGGGHLCFISQFINWVMENTIGRVLGPALEALMNIPFIQENLANIMFAMMGWLYGRPLDLSTATPEEHGSVDMYGAHFLANEQMIANGGRRLTKGESGPIMREQQRWLAEEWSRKPLLARLFDPTDYRSTVNVIARTANFDVSSRDFRTQLGNIPRFFGALPQLFGVALNNINGVAHAVEAAGYDFGVPMFGFSIPEMNIMLREDSFDMYENAGKVYGILQQTGMRDRVERCFGIEIDDNMDIRQLDNSQGEAWNYVDNMYDDCSPSGSSDLDWLRVRTYIMDYNIMVANDCFHNNDSSSCADIGFGRGGGDNNRPGIPSGDNASLAQQILDHPNITLSTGPGIGAQGAMERFARGEPVDSLECPGFAQFISDDLLRTILMMADNNYTMAINNFGLGDRVGTEDAFNCAGFMHPRGLAVDFDSIGRDGFTSPGMGSGDEATRSLFRSFIGDFMDAAVQIRGGGHTAFGVSGSGCPGFPGQVGNHTMVTWGGYCSLHLDFGGR